MQLDQKPILKTYIKNGRVDYERLRHDGEIMTLISQIENEDISGYSNKEKFAFWLNAYNLLVLKSVLEKLDKDPNWNGNTSFFRKLKFFVIEKHKVAGRKVSLLSLENKILRKEFKDPRIHFAINCGSVSCPFLPPGLFTGENLEDYLEHLTSEFINSDEVTFDLGRGILEVSQIFKMYKKDFQGEEGIKQFIKRYRRDIPNIEKLRIKYKPYDWKLNNA